MADEARVTFNLSISKDDATGFLDVRRQASFRMDVSGAKGPTPGALTIPIYGKVVPVGELTTPGICWITNHDDTNYVEVGILDVDRDVWHPLLEVGPKERWPLKLSRNLREEYTGTGTGTTGPTDALFAKANGADCVVSFEVWER